jgi:hypothetical protein
MAHSYIFYSPPPPPQKKKKVKKKKTWEEKKVYILVARVRFSLFVQRDPFIAL